MAKHKKTRREKIISDLRRKLQQTNQSASDISYYKPDLKVALSGTKINKNPSSALINPSKINYSYLKYDLFRTSGITLIITSAEVLLFMALRKHILLLPVGY